MGKASKWIRNFLVGKKEKNKKEKDFANDVMIIESLANSPNSILPIEKRRWSFTKSKSTRNDFVLRSMKSFDSIVNSEKLAKALVKYSENELQVGVTRPILQDKQGLLEHSAATRIQATFRSYLARRALCALRALVKLQALVRGHLVRKRTTATLKCMHALISIQVRARVQRITFHDESKKFSHEKDLVLHKEEHNAMDETIIDEKRVNLNTKSFSGDCSQIKRIDPGLAHFSPRLPIYGQELNKRTPSPLSHASTRQNTPNATRTKQNLPTHFSGPLPTGKKLEYDPWMPNYMANTESSRAKARSHSEPKQRPKKSVKQISRRSASNERLDFNPDDLASSSSVKKIQNRWLTKLYHSAKGVAKEGEYDSTSITTDSSNNSRSMIPHEPHVDLY